MSEDFSVPWFALHLFLLARAARVRSATSVGLAGLALGLAVSTWHASSFLFAMEAACAFAWFLRSGENPLLDRRTWMFPAVLLAFAGTVPVLRSTAFALSLPMQFVLAMTVASAWPRWRPRTVAALTWAFLLVAGWVWAKASGRGLGEYGHVFSLVVEKVRHLGNLPRDPGVLPVEARMMWQGPFATLDPAIAIGLLGVGALSIVPAFVIAWRALRRGFEGGFHGTTVLLASFSCLSLAAAWLVERTVLLPGLLLPVLGVVSLGAFERRTRRSVWIPLVASTTVLIQGFLGFRHVEAGLRTWYLPKQRQAEIRALVEAIPDRVPGGEAIAADFMNSSAILAHTGHPVVFQPKWESRECRERAAEFLATFFRGTPVAMRTLLLGKYRCRYVVFDRFTLGILHASRYVAGFPADWGGPVPGTCAAAFLSQDESVLEGVPGFRLLYRSPPTIRQSDGSPADFFRLYEIRDPASR
jgi:hypothetical protein